MISINNLESTRDKIFDEINLLPKEKLSEVYSFIHKFRLKEQKSKQEQLNVMSYAGSWKDIDNDAYNDLMTNTANRRQNAFKDRRDNAANFD